MSELICTDGMSGDITKPLFAGMERMPGGLFVYRADEREMLLYVNNVVLEIFGCRTVEEFTELTGGSFRGMVHPDDLAMVQSSISAQIDASDKNLDYVEYRIRRADGAIRWVDDYGRMTHTEEYGDVYYVFIRDITELHNAGEENLRRAEVIEGLSVDYKSIFFLNLDTGTMRPYRMESDNLLRIASERDTSTNDWSGVLPVYAERCVVAEDRELFLREMRRERIRERMTKEQTYSVGYRCRSASGDLTYAEMSIVGIPGDASHVVMGYRDVTEHTLRVQSEMAERLHTEMELEREKHANEVKSSFLFNISHDIRTPMNAIMGFVDLARRHVDEPERLSTYLEKVDESSRQLLSLIDDLLEMSRIDYGRLELHAESCMLREQIDMVIDMFRPQAEEKKLSIRTQVDLPDKAVMVDTHRFRRIMGNLISNAVKFTPAGGSVTVSARQKQASDSGYARYEFTVADTGVGMSEEFMRRMYNSFEREETSTRAGTVGTGLGLSITKSLLDIMGGSISAKSRKGEGSVFTVDLPLKLADSAAEEKNAAADKPESKAAGEYRILLVEDIEINRMLAETILAEADFLVESVPDGCDAVDAIKNHPEWYYDLVLMDIQMPVMNGYEATRAIRALGRRDTESLPIIALSANAREEDKRMSVDSGMNSHIAKPFDVAHLIRTVNEHIAARSKE